MPSIVCSTWFLSKTYKRKDRVPSICWSTWFPSKAYKRTDRVPSICWSTWFPSKPTKERIAFPQFVGPLGFPLKLQKKGSSSLNLLVHLVSLSNYKRKDRVPSICWSTWLPPKLLKTRDSFKNTKGALNFLFHWVSL